MNKISSTERASLIKLAASLPEGDETRRAILAGLQKVGIEFATKDALDKYLKEHPKADSKNHSVKKNKGVVRKDVEDTWAKNVEKKPRRGWRRSS